MKDGDGTRTSRKRQPEMTEETELGAAWQARIYGAVQRRDANALRELAKQAGSEKQAAAAPFLCSFLVPPASRWKTPRASKGGWAEARAAAIWALKEIGDVKTLPALGLTLIRERDAIVREAAVTAIHAFGPAATPMLLKILSERANWNLQGMRALITCLSSIEGISQDQKDAVIHCLVDILKNKTPQAPSRWKTMAVPNGLSLGVFSLLACVFYYALHPAPLWLYLVVGLLLSRMIATLICSRVPNVFSVQEQKERRVLHQSAFTALSRLKDKSCIPALIELAFGKPKMSSRTVAEQLLTGLLPTVDPPDRELFSASTLDLLNLALLSPQQAGLTLSILHAVGAVGNETSIKPVKRLTRWGYTKEIVEEAGRVLEVLEERKTQMKEARSLLRGSQQPALTSDQLLRPAAAQSESHREQLLRAAQNE